MRLNLAKRAQSSSAQRSMVVATCLMPAALVRWLLGQG